MSRPGKQRFNVLQKLRIDRHHVFEMAVGRTILDHPDLAIAFDDLRLDLADVFVDKSRNFSARRSGSASRASITQFGQSESVCRGKPSVGFDFCHDFKSGLSDHFGVNDGFGLN